MAKICRKGRDRPGEPIHLKEAVRNGVAIGIRRRREAENENGRLTRIVADMTFDRGIRQVVIGRKL